MGLIPDWVRVELAKMVDAPSPSARLFDIEVVEDETLPPGVLKMCGETTTVVYDVT